MGEWTTVSVCSECRLSSGGACGTPDPRVAPARPADPELGPHYFGTYLAPGKTGAPPVDRRARGADAVSRVGVGPEHAPGVIGGVRVRRQALHPAIRARNCSDDTGDGAVELPPHGAELEGATDVYAQTGDTQRYGGQVPRAWLVNTIPGLWSTEERFKLRCRARRPDSRYFRAGRAL